MSENLDFFFLNGAKGDSFHLIPPPEYAAGVFYC